MVPDEHGPDIIFLEKLKSLLVEQIKQGKKFCLCIGGGKVNSMYNQKLQIANPAVTHDQLDWLGIYCIHLNALFVQYVLGDIAHPTVLQSPDEWPQEEIQAPVVVCGAKEPGHSSNYAAVLFAQHCGAKTIINVSNIDYVYDADPRTNPQAKSYTHLTWDMYRSFIPQEWTPKLSVPFDPIASVLAQNLSLQVVFMSGDSIDPIKNYLETGTCIGTIIEG